MLKPLSGTYDARASLGREFVLQEGTGGRMLGEATLKRPGGAEIFTRSYETSKLLDAHYRALYAGTAMGNWAVEVTVEYAEPRDTEAEKQFIDAVYAGAAAEVAAQPGPLAAGASTR